MHDEKPTAAPSLQETVLRLQGFWAERGCVLLPACDLGVPFATLVPDVFFGLLGPEPWRSTCLQPLRRPLDARGGEHPYRLFQHLQMQVVLGPAPTDVQGVYLESLEALGFELRLHDLRFAEWTWEPVSVGALGTGWRVLLDGLGVTRITFLERLADRDLEPPAVEISYGLERLMMPLQGVSSAFEIEWTAGGPDYGRLRRGGEGEHSRYVGEVADAGDVRTRLEALDREAERCLKAGLARPAYELAVRCLEPLDVLEAGGVLSARERSGWLERLRLRVAAAAELHQRANRPARRRRPAKKAAPAKKTTRAPAPKKQARATTPKKKARAAAKKKKARAAAKKNVEAPSKAAGGKKKKVEVREEPSADGGKGGV